MTKRVDLTDGPTLTPNAWLRFDVVRAELEAAPRGRVLEIGPGAGAMAARLVAAGHDYVGVELSDASREITSALVTSIPDGTARLVASTDELTGDATFNLLIAFEVLEHVELDAEALADWVGHLAPGARVVLSVPAWQSRFSHADTEVGHVRRYSPDEFAELARGAGLSDVAVTLYGFGLGDVLEAARNQLAKRRLAKRPVESESALDRTKRSGRFFQPPAGMNRVIELATWPFRLLQRRFPHRGPGLVLTATLAPRPGSTETPSGETP